MIHQEPERAQAEVIGVDGLLWDVSNLSSSSIRWDDRGGSCSPQTVTAYPPTNPPPKKHAFIASSIPSKPLYPSRETVASSISEDKDIDAIFLMSPIRKRRNSLTARLNTLHKPTHLRRHTFHDTEDDDRKKPPPTKEDMMDNVDLLDIEVSPGVFVAVYSAKETIKGLHRGQVRPTTCLGCDMNLYCLLRAESVACPVCYSIGPVTFEHPPMMEGVGGVSLGISESEFRREMRKTAADAYR